jgi:hypothetical protein
LVRADDTAPAIALEFMLSNASRRQSRSVSAGSSGGTAMPRMASSAEQAPSSSLHGSSRMRWR